MDPTLLRVEWVIFDVSPSWKTVISQTININKSNFVHEFLKGESLRNNYQTHWHTPTPEKFKLKDYSETSY